jgi:hypothetical protein
MFKATLAILCMLSGVHGQSLLGSCTAGSLASPCSNDAVFATGNGLVGSFATFHATGSLLGGDAPTLFAVATSIYGVPVPLNGYVGDLLLEPAGMLVLAPGTSPTFPGMVAVDLFIPSDPALVGTELHSQRVQLRSTTGQWTLSYAWGFTIA